MSGSVLVSDTGETFLFDTYHDADHHMEELVVDHVVHVDGDTDHLIKITKTLSEQQNYILCETNSGTQ